MAINPLNDISRVYLEQVVDEAKKGDGNLANNYPPYDKVTRGDIIAGALGQDQMGGKSKKKLKKVEEAKKPNDGNLANNYPPYDKVTRGDVIAGRLGKDQMGGKKKIKEGYSNWREDLKEVITKDQNDKKITEKNVNNKIKINPTIDLGDGRMGGIRESIENLGGELIEMVEIDEKTLTPAETKKKEEIVMSMKKKGDFSKYGKRAKEVMYATATKQAKKVAEQAMELQPKTQQTKPEQPQKPDPAIAAKQKQAVSLQKQIELKKVQLLSKGIPLTQTEEVDQVDERFIQPGGGHVEVDPKRIGMKSPNQNMNDKIKQLSSSGDDASHARARKIMRAKLQTAIKGKRLADKEAPKVAEEIEQIDERRKEDKVAGNPRKPRDKAFEIVAKSMGIGRMGVQPRGKKKEPGKKPPKAGEYGGPASPAQKVAKRRAAARAAQEFMSDTRGT